MSLEPTFKLATAPCEAAGMEAVGSAEGTALSEVAPSWARTAARSSDPPTATTDPTCSAPGEAFERFETDPLLERHPGMSAANLRVAPIVAAATLVAALAGLAAILGPPAILAWMTVFLALPFLCVSAVRLAAIAGLAWPRAERQPIDHPSPRAAEALPRYAVLVPLYDEVEVLRQLIDGLSALDYPASRLDVCLIVEACDTATRTGLSHLTLPPHMRVLVVPPGRPRTKPRALNHALRTVDSEFVVVYDAEDLPDPDQLRRALAVFAAGGPATACVQARLGLYNPEASLISRQFTLEYAALFVGILPALERLRLPLPLGGTSNHFRRNLLQNAGGWDSYNVTEDADLGIRLVRLGYSVRTMASTTWEEAPETPAVWMRQRTRWLKGWMQTYLVHMRAPSRLWRELGPWRFLGFQVLMGGMILSALVHPWVYVGLASHLLSPPAFSATGAADPSSYLTDPLWLMAMVNLAAGFLSAMALGAVTARPTYPRLVFHALLMPIYWLAISAAGYRAVVQLAARPFLWEKTPHRGRANRAARERRRLLIRGG